MIKNWEITPWQTREGEYKNLEGWGFWKKHLIEIWKCGEVRVRGGWSGSNVYIPQRMERKTNNRRLQRSQEQRSTLPRSQQRISLSYLNFEGNKVRVLEGFLVMQMGWKSHRCLQCQFSYLHREQTWGPVFILNRLFLWVYFRIKLEMALSEIAAMPSEMALILLPGHLHCGDQRQDPHSPAEECTLGTLPHNCLDGAVMGTARWGAPGPLTRILQSPRLEAFTTNITFQSWTVSK